MRSTPRRFRAAAWLAFSVLQPAQALAKVDPLEAPIEFFPTRAFRRSVVADVGRRHGQRSVTRRGRRQLRTGIVAFTSARNEQEGCGGDRRRATRIVIRISRGRGLVGAVGKHDSKPDKRFPFLRVFGSQEVLDGTLVHPEDYALAKKLAAALEIELPPDAPPGYVTPDFTAHEPAAEPDQLSEAQPKSETKIDVEDFSSAGEKAHEFAVDAVTDSGPEAESEDSRRRGTSG